MHRQSNTTWLSNQPIKNICTQANAFYIKRISFCNRHSQDAGLGQGAAGRLVVHFLAIIIRHPSPTWQIWRKTQELSTR